jgi:hypothetical protein
MQATFSLRQLLEGPTSTAESGGAVFTIRIPSWRRDLVG